MRTKLWTILAGLAGLGLGIWVVVHEGVNDILGVLTIAGWSLLWLIPMHAVPVAIDARGWQVLLRPLDPPRHATLPFLFWIATVREAVNRLLPVANIGGELIGIRLALLRPLRGAAVTASILVEVLLTVVNQYIFTAIGLILLVVLLRDTAASNALSIGLIVTLPVPVLLYFLLRNGHLFERAKRGLVRLLGAEHHLSAQLAGSAPTFDRDLRQLLRMPGPLARALAWQLAGMIVGSVEVWFALALLGHPVAVWEALTLESLSLAVRNFAFFVPAGVGVQEASFVVFGDLLGIPPDIAVAVSLTKRLRDVGFGIPALLSWQWVESHSLRARLAAKPAGPAES